MGLAWDVPPEEAFVALTESEAAAIEADIVALLRGVEEEAEQWMKVNAPWTDCTTDARTSLFTQVQHEARVMVSLLLSHGSLIEYSVYLERSHRSRYSVLLPALDYWSHRIFEDVRAIVRRHGG